MPLIKDVKKHPNDITYLDVDEKWKGQVVIEEIGPELGFWAQSEKLGEQIYMKCDDFSVTKNSVIGIGNCLIQECTPSIERAKCKSYNAKSVKLQNLTVTKPREVNDFCEDPSSKSECAEPLAYAFFSR